MSNLSGKCDLYDHISGLSGWRDKNGNKVDINNSNGPFYSDIREDFKVFKERVGGVIYQYKQVYYHDWYSEKDFVFIKVHCKGFDYKKIVKLVDDKRCKQGKREVINYTFTLYNKPFDFKRQKRLDIQVPIYFNEILDLLPYLPYIVVAASKNHVIISEKSWVEHSRDLSISMCSDYEIYDCYKEELKKLYIEVIKNEYNGND